jgi:hypothetical protein
MTFRTTITVAVTALIAALAACLILIQILTFHAAAREAASAYMDADSANALSRREARLSELASLVRVLSTNPFLADSDERSEVDGAAELSRRRWTKSRSRIASMSATTMAIGRKCVALAIWTRRSGGGCGHRSTPSTT